MPKAAKKSLERAFLDDFPLYSPCFTGLQEGGGHKKCATVLGVGVWKIGQGGGEGGSVITLTPCVPRYAWVPVYYY